VRSTIHKFKANTHRCAKEPKEEQEEEKEGPIG
jgi:hypothetical protein